jgi:hypothetical protein
MLPTDRDWVRFSVGDTDVSDDEEGNTNAELDDYEIDALLVEEANKYLAAARAGDVLIAKGGNVVSKMVGDLRLENSEEPKSAYTEHLRRLREKGARILLPSTQRHFINL